MLAHINPYRSGMPGTPGNLNPTKCRIQVAMLLREGSSINTGFDETSG
jgi:hypothetical protein